ncbi:hypothetical protein COCC4DRAFT_30649 [Bipolaris maydis ATCC 48331]|uniref:Uncharacterized protein n=2 Tax=Cochliobolus heterostrophus TaxID=5016 RepID=M2UF43_COCH5|nr:uncharacterized protein COCC4DRAFT_30649 [Bipolaris maydis ATCC 48331]EMD92311.1 hypothetical protein COCHEDRAFT_1021149 [Bipolaris maydis C5]KAJ5022153.1 hypothetical protein J3E73DRAFT_345159 [Bipolaris maydis]ENI08003.1 hypothetical protein COCC4DRAFT_30649 [Bipolaris maydis ATCC 48331]KAJ5060843.1 hypothetical protein J3E74DRAFT_335542 [Bipolaris maydis]KAJ6197980.1 hypothetical protein J3E72DRAFT_315574 [Bipolaris maydis]
MRHPAAPTIIAVLLGFLFFMVVWSRVRADDHHEGNPHPDDIPRKKEKEEANLVGDGASTAKDDQSI